jgi:hypothetical protein
MRIGSVCPLPSAESTGSQAITCWQQVCRHFAVSRPHYLLALCVVRARFQKYIDMCAPSMYFQLCQQFVQLADAHCLYLPNQVEGTPGHVMHHPPQNTCYSVWVFDVCDC